jgi:hypothetical protein
MTMAVDKLFDLGQQHDTPVGASFAPSGWYAPFSAAIVYAVGWVQMDLATLAADLDNDITSDNALTVVNGGVDKTFREQLEKNGQLFDTFSKSRSDKFKYYYFDRERADVLCQMLDVEEPAYTLDGRKFRRNPEVRWRVETALDDVVSLNADAKEKFERDVLSWEVELKAMQKNSPNWFNWHGLVLPSIVAAYAKLKGWKAGELGFDISELTQPEDDIIVTDKFQLEMIGNTDVGLEGSKLFIRRKALWGALNENNVKASNPDDTESPQLKEALTVATSTWNSPVFARVIQVPSPKVDDTWEGNAGRVRSRIPILTDFYRNVKAAVKAYESETEAREAVYANGGVMIRPSAPVSSKDGAEPDATVSPIPEAWVEIPDEWLETMKAIKADIGKKPRPVIKKNLEEMADTLADEYMVTVDDVLDSWDSV